MMILCRYEQCYAVPNFPLHFVEENTRARIHTHTHTRARKRNKKKKRKKKRKKKPGRETSSMRTRARTYSCRAGNLRILRF